MADHPDVWTFRSLIAGRMQVEAYCDDCRFHKQVDLAALGDRLGPDAPAMSPDLKKVLVCPKCGSRNVSFIYSAASVPTSIETAWAGRTPTTSPAPDGRRQHRSRSRK